MENNYGSTLCSDQIYIDMYIKMLGGIGVLWHGFQSISIVQPVAFRPALASTRHILCGYWRASTYVHAYEFITSYYMLSTCWVLRINWSLWSTDVFLWSARWGSITYVSVLFVNMSISNTFIIVFLQGYYLKYMGLVTRKPVFGDFRQSEFQTILLSYRD